MPPEDKDQTKGKDGKTGGDIEVDDTPNHAKEISELKATVKTMADTIAKLSGKPIQKDDEDLDEDLITKARKDRENNNKKASDSKALEAALKFSLQSKEFLKQNESLLPQDVAGIFANAEKENYDSAIDKDRAIKAGMVQSFFQVQENLDLLTHAQRTQLETYLKLTNTGKQEKAQEVYDNIFEPTFEMLKRVRKAEALQKGHGTGGEIEDGYKRRLMERSNKHFLGVKQNA